MKELILLGAVLCVFGAGFWVMTRLDRFLAHLRQERASGPEQLPVPACVLLRAPVDEDALLDEVRRFRSQHPQMQILLCDASDPDGLPER
ncbi:MAG: hypothetical protein ACI4JC_07320 [Faecalibacterium sp.]